MSTFDESHKKDAGLQAWLHKAEPKGPTLTGPAAADTGTAPVLGGSLAQPALQGAAPAAASPLNFMSEGATSGLAHAGATTAAATATPAKKEYVDMDAKGKTGALVDLMDGSRDVLKQNGVSSRGEELLAGIMRNEGGRNGRRSAIGSEFNRDAAALNKLDLEHLTDKQLKHLTSDQKALLELSQEGKVNLKDKESVKDAGIDIRTTQYTRMQELSQKADLTKAEKAELAKLKGVSVAGGGKLNDFRGMSGDRFHEVFDEGQTRFELAQYSQFRKSYESQSAKHKPGTDMTLHAGIGNAKLDATQQGQLHNNYDQLADFSTSYGTSQIMGLYAAQGQLNSKDGKGQDHSYSLAELKGSAQRFTPNSDDVGMQLAFMNMKGIDMSHPPAPLTLAQEYNGKSPAAVPYAANMVSGASAYHNAKLAKEKADGGPTH